MSGRWFFWCLGFGVGVASAAVVPEPLFPGARLAAFIAVVLGIGSAAELVAFVRQRQRRRLGGRRRPRSMRPADGRVEVARLPGVLREPNARDPRFGGYRALDPTFHAPTIAEASGEPPGPGPPLLGRVVLCSLFVGLDGGSWSDEELERSHQALLRSGAWLENEATRWSAALNVELAETYFVAELEEPDEVVVGFVPEGDDVGPFEEAAGYKAMVVATRAAARIGFESVAHLTRTVADRLEADAVVWLLHLRRAGRSFAPTHEETATPELRLAVCYCREESFPEPLAGPARTDPVTVVHELLHLFGATDKYGRRLDEFEPNAVTSREVMLLSESRLSRLRIDLETAREIGWVPPGGKRPTAAANPVGSRRPS